MGLFDVFTDPFEHGYDELRRTVEKPISWFETGGSDSTPKPTPTPVKKPCSSCSGSGCSSCGGAGTSAAQMEIARGQLKLAQQANAIAQDQYKHSLTYRPVEKMLITDVKAGYDPNFYGAKERNVPIQQLAANIMTEARQGSQKGVSATSPSAVVGAMGTGGFAGYQAGRGQTEAQGRAKEKTDQGGLKVAAIGQKYPAQVTEGFGSASGIAGKAGDITYQALSAQQAAAAAARADAWARYNAEMQVWQQQQQQAQDLANQERYLEATQPSSMFGTYICTEMMRQGYADENMVKASINFSKMISRSTYKGYTIWAKPYAKWLRGHPLMSKITACFARQYMKYAQYKNNKNSLEKVAFNFKGAIIVAIGKPICWTIGKIFGEKS